jgi:RNA polymerase sigma-54 factor
VSLHLRQNLGMRMDQRLKLTPQMIQSIEILLLPQMALEERIMNEVETNPVLELVDAPSQTAEDREIAEATGTAPDHDLMSAQDEAWLWKRKSRQDDDDGPSKMAALAATPERPPQLAEHLAEQLRFVEMSPETREIAHEISWQLDRRGYLTVPLTDLVTGDRIGEAEEALDHIRRCDPAGIGARDLRDCLLLQLARQAGDNTFEMAVVRDHLDDLLRNRLPVIAQATGMAVDRIQEVVEVVAGLDPKPGLPYASGQNHIVVPDVMVERDERDEWIISVPDGRLPKVEVNQAYHQLYDSVAPDSKEKSYLKEQLANARFIIDAVAQRKRTLLKIVTEIVKHQRAFLEQGIEHLRPLMRQDIADKIGMHVATVSRAVKDKYIQTPSGVLPLASFFSGGIATQDGGEAESSKSVKLRIHKLIDHEDKKNPLSDQDIADQLAKDGLDISRRTVTKYRIADGIPSTRQRRVF